MTTTQDNAAEMSDFDNSDEDLTSLLADDDDDIYSKKIFGNSPVKTSNPEGSSSSLIKTKQQTKTLSPSHSFETPSKVITKPFVDNSSTKKGYNDTLDDFLESTISRRKSSDLKISSPEKYEQSSFKDEETDFLDDLNTSSFSPSKDKSSHNPIKKAKSIDKQSDIVDDLNTTDKNKPKTSEERRGSFFDDFLQKLSPRHGRKKSISADITEEVIKKNEDSEEEMLGAYVPTPPKKSGIASDSLSKSPKKRTSLSKQVSFKDLSDDFSENDNVEPKGTISPVKETSFKQPSFESKKNESNESRTRRSEKVNSNKKEDIDWLNFFKDSPKKTSKAAETNRKDSGLLEKADLPVFNKSKPSMKRQSSADWLGLSDSKGLDDDDYALDENKLGEIPLTNLKSSRPKTAPVIRPRHQEQNKQIDDWNDIGDDFIGGINQPISTDLSEILKESETKLPERKSSTSFLNESSEIMKSDAFSASKNKKDQIPKKQMVNTDVLPDTFTSNSMISRDFHSQVPLDIPPTSNFQQNYEQTAALHSMQLMLDDSIKERNKLIKENENIKATFEEKIKSLEEFHKSEKKMLEDSCNTMKSSLREEYEIKIKSLEERLSLITEEKERQAKLFEEKLQTILKEHKLEMQRLKDLHSQSINIMKSDHEDALNRLKRLKEQEVEAVLSTQMHSKSLQQISDQLEARASELASLQNKIEERNQNTLREKQALLDAKEKDLKALQNRLQKQVEDNEDERTRLQQLVLRLESRLQKLTMEGEEDHWETQQMKAKLTIQQKYLEEEQKLNQYQLEKEKEKLRISQDALLHEQKTVLLQLAQERQQLNQEKIDMQSLAKSIKEEDAKLHMRKLKEESSIQTEKQFLLEERSKLHFEKERMKEECFQIEREKDSLQREKQQLKREKDMLKDLEINLKRKSAEVEEMATVAAQEQEKANREQADALAIKREQQLKMQQYTQQMQMLMDKERHILSEREKLIEEKTEFEHTKNSVLCTKCKLGFESSVEAAPPNMNMPVVFPLPTNINGFSQVHSSFVDPNLVIWQIAAQKDREFLQEELAYLKSLKESNKKKNGS